MTKPKIIMKALPFDMDQALAEMRELAALSKSRGFDLFMYLRELNDLGAAVYRTDIDCHSAITASDNVVHYKLNDGLKALLLTFRARNLHTGKIKRRARKGRTFGDARNAV